MIEEISKEELMNSLRKLPHVRALKSGEIYTEIAAWLNEYNIHKPKTMQPGIWITSRELLNRYNTWATNNGYNPTTIIRFTNCLNKHDMTAQQKTIMYVNKMRHYINADNNYKDLTNGI